MCVPSRLAPPSRISLSNITEPYLLAPSSDNNVIIYYLLAVGKMSVRLNETETIVDKMVNFFVEHEDLRTKVSLD